MSRSCARWHGLAVGDYIGPLLLGGVVGGVKPGLEFFTAHGPKGVAAVAKAGLPICLDLKFHDIPNTAAGAIRAAVELSPSMPTVTSAAGRRCCARRWRRHFARRRRMAVVGRS